jgi:hypothetical protein
VYQKLNAVGVVVGADPLPEATRLLVVALLHRKLKRM